MELWLYFISLQKLLSQVCSWQISTNRWNNWRINPDKTDMEIIDKQTSDSFT